MVEIDVIEALSEQSPVASEAVLSRLLAQDDQGARIEAAARQWPPGLLEEVNAILAKARSQDEPFPPDGDPEEFLEYARGDAQAAQKGFLALATWELLSNRVGSLSQCRWLAQWLVHKYIGVPVEPVALSVADFASHANANEDGQYLVRWRAFSWVVSGMGVCDGKVFGPHPGQSCRIEELHQVWYLTPSVIQ